MEDDSLSGVERKFEILGEALIGMQQVMGERR